VSAFHDSNGNFELDIHDVAVRCVMADGKIDQSCGPLSGGFPLVVIDPLGVKNVFAMPASVYVVAPGNYTFISTPLPSWKPAVTFIDGTSQGLQNPSTVEVGKMSRMVQFGMHMLPVSIHGHTYFDANKNGMRDRWEALLPGTLVCLITPDMKPVIRNAYDNPFPDVDQWGCQFSNANGIVRWQDLRPSNYKILLNMALSKVKGLVPTSTVEFDVLLQGIDEYDVSFGAIGDCSGLSPEYWQNWRSLYSERQFASLFHGTIAQRPRIEDSIELADQLLSNSTEHYSNQSHQLSAFLFANQLTLALTQRPELRNPQAASLYLGCVAAGTGETTTLQATFASAERALQSIEDESSSTKPSKSSLTALINKLRLFSTPLPSKLDVPEKSDELFEDTSSYSSSTGKSKPKASQSAHGTSPLLIVLGKYESLIVVNLLQLAWTIAWLPNK
jgi:hypothetical protein